MMKDLKKSLVVCSGGLDSVTLSYLCASLCRDIHLVTFDYGQRHKKEISYAKECAKRLDAPHTVVDVSLFQEIFSDSSLVGGKDVPDGYYREDSMKQTVVPNRNAIFLTIAFALAVKHEAEAIGIAVHGGDHFIYPDCRPNFIKAFQQMENASLEGGFIPQIYAPFVSKSKGEIVKVGFDLGVPFEGTWSCYKGGEKHCGRCGTCVERAEAFFEAGVTDPTEYEDASYWKEARQSFYEEPFYEEE